MALERNPHADAVSGIPRPVWALGIVSLLMDLSSEMVHSLLPVFLASVLGVSVTAIGALEGVAEASVLAVKMASGAASDLLGKRKALALLGYGMAALSKPLFPLAHSFAVIVLARMVDRVGKGIRGAPRDALIGDIAPLAARGASFGLRQSLDTVGAIGGPLAASLLMVASGGSFRLVFWVAVVPAALCVLVLATFVREPARLALPDATPPRFAWAAVKRFPAAFWWIVAVGSSLTLARFSEAFLVLRSRSLGLEVDYVPLVMAAMNLVYALSAYPAGRLSDRIGRWRILGAGTVLLIAADLVLALGGGIPGLLAGVALWGLHMGLSQGLLAALVVDAAPAGRRGMAFGLFNLVSGAMLLAASLIAGALWDRVGPAATFYAGALFAALALIGLTVQGRGGPAGRADA